MSRHISIFNFLLFSLLMCALAAGQGVPPIPPVLSVTPMGTVTQNPVIYGRDGAISALIDGKSVWTFGDTPMSVPGIEGNNWADNTLSWTNSLDASNGINLNHDLLDSTGAPAEFLPYLSWERDYNYAHDNHHCTEDPCGAEFAMWPGQPIPDPARRRALFPYYELWRVPGQAGWRSVGTGFAVATLPGKITRPIQNPDSKTSTLMWGKDEVGFNSGSITVNDTLYAYGCAAGFLVQNCQLGRVPLSGVLNKQLWTFYAGNNTWSTNAADAVTVFQGGDAGNTIYYNSYLEVYMVIYSGVFSDNLYYRVAYQPWGPWSDQALLFTGLKGWNNNANYAGHAHAEFAEANGQIQYITYAHTTGPFRSDIPLVKVVFGRAK